MDWTSSKITTVVLDMLKDKGYLDNTHMPSADHNGWMNRGGDWYNGSYAGTFGFSSYRE